MLNISGIEEGYVIDHIRAGSCMKIYDALNLDKCEGEVAIIKNNKIIEKKSLSLPDKITGVAVCRNPRCITSIEQGLKQTFILSDRKRHIYRCMYCEERL